MTTIFGIRSIDTYYVYIGMTKQKNLSKFLANNKYKYKKMGLSKNKQLNKILKFDGLVISRLLHFPNKNKKELKDELHSVQNMTKYCLNQTIYDTNYLINTIDSIYYKDILDIVKQYTCSSQFDFLNNIIIGNSIRNYNFTLNIFKRSNISDRKRAIIFKWFIDQKLNFEKVHSNDVFENTEKYIQSLNDSYVSERSFTIIVFNYKKIKINNLVFDKLVKYIKNYCL
jgi:hypothetical protein